MKTILEKINQQILEGHYHGASLAIYHQGRWQEFYLGTVDGDFSVRSGLIYDLASVSKVVGVATIAALWKRKGILDIDKPLQYYYPDFQDSQLSIRRLLTHTSGINPFIPNRNQLTADELKEAINRIRIEGQTDFFYTDINFLLLGFMMEHLSHQSLAELFNTEIFQPWHMTQTGFGPRVGAVPTVKGITDGYVHDPKAKVLQEHTGSAGLFSTIKDLETFLEHYLSDDFAAHLWTNLNPDKTKARALGWNLEGDWIEHTGYTGPFIMANRQTQQAVIFLTNRTFEKDNREQWIVHRKLLMALIMDELAKVSSNKVSHEI